MSKPLDFQSIIMALQEFWAAQGCLIWQPYYSQVGAGTMNPATFLRVLGPEPWNVAYVEPSVRPDDGRYGDNPNRLQTHYQFQVILKPDPGNPQEVYLRSLEAIGIDPGAHDIRFVEDNWESPALGAWGLGWEVWLDGLEITQFTYFQQAGGLQLDPVSVELTYGLDRIATPLQRVYGFQNIRWNPTHTFGDVNLQAEQEQSKYYFEVADVERMRQAYELYEAETRASLDQGLVLPAYDNLLRLSHLFNVMDTRGAVGVTQRQAYFRGMRRLAAGVAAAYVEQRQRMEYPWLPEKVETDDISRRDAEEQGNQTEKISGPSKPADFLLEVGTEELPPSEIIKMLSHLEITFKQMVFDVRSIAYDDFMVFGTPRRLIVYVSNLHHEITVDKPIKGPPEQVAFDENGKPTKSLKGWAAQNNISLDEYDGGKALVKEIDGGRYISFRGDPEIIPTISTLAHVLPAYIKAIKFEKPMRWNSSNAAFSRPIRWLLALHGDQVVPFEYAGLQSSNTTRGLRFVQPENFVVKDAKEYFKKLKKQGVLLNPEERKAAIQKQVSALAAEVGGTVPDAPDLLAEVTHLVEAPAALIGAYDESHLELPREVLIAVMKKHQRYFPVEKEGKLLPYFITAVNGDREDMNLIQEGNEAVLRARFEDAAFFIAEDMQRPLETYLPELDTLTFQQDLGSMGAKSERILALVEALADSVELGAEQETAVRAAALCKADLVTKMVIEMTSLQGVMGQHYARSSGESPKVGQAIFEHYLPRFAGDQTPASKAGLVVGLADRLDSLAGLFAAGLAPSSSKDPFALRRAAIGLVQSLVAWDLGFDLDAGLEAAKQQLPIEATDESQAECLHFIIRRLRGLFLEQGSRYDVVDAVLAAQGHNPAGAASAVEELSAWVGREDWQQTLDAYARCVRISRDFEERFAVEPARFTEKAENVLLEALERAEKTARAAGSAEDFLKAFVPMIPAIDAFFEDVLVMDEDKKLRKNRLGLLQRIAALADGVADLSYLEGF